MSVKLNPYLSFKDNAKEAMEFYRSIFGGELTLSTFKEFKAAQTPAEENLIMHAELNNGKGINFMSSDTPSRMAYQQGNNFNMSISGDDEDLLRSYF
ncbi:MAG TPA: VOC family protein, partial [Patescibacteria group bacterium]|nr:VOC family protein [Patescibacteria group bacterium]